MQLWLCVMAKGSVRDGGWRVLEGRGDEEMGKWMASRKGSRVLWVRGELRTRWREARH